MVCNFREEHACSLLSGLSTDRPIRDCTVRHYNALLAMSLTSAVRHASAELLPLNAWFLLITGINWIVVIQVFTAKNKIKTVLFLHSHSSSSWSCYVMLYGNNNGDGSRCVGIRVYELNQLQLQRWTTLLNRKRQTNQSQFRTNKDNKIWFLCKNKL